MSEKWLTALKKIEWVDPSPDLLERATEHGPTLPDPGPPTGLRVTTLLIAVLVAAAGSWAAFAGLSGMGGAQHEAADGQEVFKALWPETSRSEAEQVQTQVDASDSAVQWRIDSGSVALRYAQEVLGWPNPIAGSTGTNDADKVIVGVHGPDVSCSGAECQNPQAPQRIVTLTLERLVRSGDGGIWSVTAVNEGS
jgi:hypothetical protein